MLHGSPWAEMESPCHQMTTQPCPKRPKRSSWVARKKKHFSANQNRSLGVETVISCISNRPWQALSKASGYIKMAFCIRARVYFEKMHRLPVYEHSFMESPAKIPAKSERWHKRFCPIHNRTVGGSQNKHAVALVMRLDWIHEHPFLIT